MTKECKICGNQFQRNSKESQRQFGGRKYCSYACSNRARRASVRPASQITSKYRTRRVNGKTVLEHRLVVERHIGRPLEPSEQVHHINHNRLDNRIENLQVVTQEEHSLIHSGPPIEKLCSECGQVFLPRRRTAMTCGRTCYGQLRSRINLERVAKKLLEVAA